MPLVPLGPGPVAVPGRVDGRDREAAVGHVTAGPGHQARALLVLATPMAEQDQRTSAGGAGGYPERAVDVAEDEELFRDAASGRLRREVQRLVAFRDACGHPQRPPRSGDLPARSV